MAVEITPKIYIEGISYTPYLVTPVKWGNFLDEQLDEAYITLVSVPFKDLAPLTVVDLICTNKMYFGNIKNPQVLKTYPDYHKRMIVANDSAEEYPVGSGRYTHNIYLIEETKRLEMYIVDSLTFTNSLGNSFLEFPIPAPISDMSIYPDDEGDPPNNPYVTPIEIGGLLNIESFAEIYPILLNINYYETTSGYVKIYHNGDFLTGISYSNQGGGVSFNELLNFTTSLTVESGVYSVEYLTKFAVGDIDNRYTVSATFSMVAITNQYPLKRFTCKDVINRLLNLAEPLQGNNLVYQLPRFRLNADQAAAFDKIYAPEYTMTRGTLRECLQEVGKVIHGEPRLTTLNGYNEIVFDLYGGTEKADTPPLYTSRMNSRAIEQYCTSVDSTAQNLVNQLGWAGGVITEPRGNAFKTVRTETQYVRIGDSNMDITVTQPFSSVAKLYCGLTSQTTTFADITDFVFESTIYNSKLSSYENTYPYSKAYGLYYEIGGKSIKGLNFKPDVALFPEFKNYAIINILEKVLGVSLNTDGEAFYPTLAFRVTYVPYFDVRVTQSKQNVKNYKANIALAYNQSANVIESTAYGENLKGVVARLGNPERSVTVALCTFAQIPKAGTKYDNDYYISTVSVEVYKTYIRCTMGLTKDFNRISAYIGVSSERRLYEVSERAAYERTSLFKEYVVIGDEETPDDNSYLGDNFMALVGGTFTGTAPTDTNNNTIKPDHVVAYGQDYQGNELPTVELPIVATALGNAIVFIWSYQDNYSAGAMSTYKSNNGVSGYWQNDVQYTDYYGKMYRYNFDVRYSLSRTLTYDEQTTEGLAFPSVTSTSYSGGGIFGTPNTLVDAQQLPYIYRKDSREITQVNAEVEFVTNRDDIIIGSAIASNCPAVSSTIYAAKLYFLSEPVNKFAPKYTTDLSSVPSADITVTQNGKQLTITAGTVPSDCVAWAIITEQSQTSETVEDDEGNVTTQTIYNGGEVIVASNTPLTAGATFPALYLTAKHNPFTGGKLILYSAEITNFDDNVYTTVYTGYTFNEDTGIFTLTNPVNGNTLVVGDIIYSLTNGTSGGGSAALIYEIKLTAIDTSTGDAQGVLSTLTVS